MLSICLTLKEVLCEVRCLKSTEDMILALAGQFKQLMILLFFVPLCSLQFRKKTSIVTEKKGHFGKVIERQNCAFGASLQSTKIHFKG